MDLVCKRTHPRKPTGQARWVQDLLACNHRQRRPVEHSLTAQGRILKCHEGKFTRPKTLLFCADSSRLGPSQRTVKEEEQEEWSLIAMGVRA